MSEQTDGGKLLELAVAKAICCAGQRCEGCKGRGEGGCFDLALWDVEARAAIAVVRAHTLPGDQ